MKANIISSISAAEKIVNGGRIKNTLDDMGSISKMAAALYYQSAALEYLVNSSRAQSAVKTKVFGQISKDFGSYVDMQARSLTSQLHHVYEWKRVGSPESRLWKLNMKQTGAYDMNINYSFKQSKIPVPSPSGTKRYVFREKARIMEFRIPVTIKPRRLGGRLAFVNKEGRTVVMPRDRSVFVKNPGGNMVFQGFSRVYERFFNSSMVNQSIDASGIQKSYSRAAKNAVVIPKLISGKIVVNKISTSTVRQFAKSRASREASRI